MMLTIFKSKIHRATVTQADLHYAGSLTVDPVLLEAAGMLPYEQVHVLNINTGARFTTYLIEGERGAGTICLNGAAARMGAPGDLVIAITYAQMDAAEAKGFRPTVVLVDEQHHIVDLTRPGHVPAGDADC